MPRPSLIAKDSQIELNAVIPRITPGLKANMGTWLRNGPRQVNKYAVIAQWIEHLASDQGVGGSSPSGRTILRAAKNAVRSFSEGLLRSEWRAKRKIQNAESFLFYD